MSSVFSPGGISISASAAPHCGVALKIETKPGSSSAAVLQCQNCLPFFLQGQIFATAKEQGSGCDVTACFCCNSCSCKNDRQFSCLNSIFLLLQTASYFEVSKVNSRLLQSARVQFQFSVCSCKRALSTKTPHDRVSAFQRRCLAAAALELWQ